MSSGYDFRTIEPKWQKTWERERTLNVRRPSDAPDVYVLDMFPNPSGPLHMGHCKNYGIGDVVARYRIRRGDNVFHPMGWDAFGLPGELAAHKAGAHPRAWTLQNIRIGKAQFRKLGIHYDWDHEICSCEPDYYRWNQWLFLKLYERGLAYRAEAPVNFCPDCDTTLANEEVITGACERCGATVERRPMRQWFLKITAYADALLDGLDRLTGWPERIRAMQRNWIGRTEGAEVRFCMAGGGEQIVAFTTRPDTLFGVTFIALSPDHPMAARLCRDASALARIRHAQESREDGAAPQGIPTGAEVIHPLTGKRAPVWVADYVLTDYGTGAVMGVPAHDARDFAFANAYNLGVARVIRAADGSEPPLPHENDGMIIASGPFTGMDSRSGGAAIAKALRVRGAGGSSVAYRLRDWCISRQRYWGTPIPVVHCPRCGEAPVPEADLPVRLPHMADFHPDGRSPLARVPDFVHTDCPACGAKARRECDTMTGFVCSSWYFLRFVSPGESAEPFAPDAVRRWAPVVNYIGGKEHAVGHLMYARFITRFLKDIGRVDFDEPFIHLFNQGVVYKDGAKMSKSKGNVVSVNDMVQTYGADTARVFVLFATPPNRDMEWSDSGAEGIFRFLNRVWRAVADEVGETAGSPPCGDSETLDRAVHRTVRSVTADMDRMRYNTAISRLMELTTAIQQALQSGGESAAVRQAREALVSMLAPFAPHIAEALWRQMGKPGSVHRLPWPDYDAHLAAEETVTVVVQVNGKVRDRFQAPAGTPDADLEAQATGRERVRAYLGRRAVRRAVVVPDRLVNFVTG